MHCKTSSIPWLCVKKWIMEHPWQVLSQELARSALKQSTLKQSDTKQPHAFGRGSLINRAALTGAAVFHVVVQVQTSKCK